MVELKNPDALEERIGQQRKLESFFLKHFHDPDDDSMTGAFYQFEDGSEFEELASNHLRSLIRDELSYEEQQRLQSHKVWRGSPYRGLEHFDVDHADIFFGRRKPITELIAHLKQRALDDNPFVMLLGMSGVGKSSMVNAGLLPMLSEPDVVEGVKAWRVVRYRPSEEPDRPIAGLLNAFQREDGFGDLGDDVVLTAEMQREPDSFGARLRARLAQLAEAEGLQDNQLRCFMFIDQFEELFTNDDLDESVRVNITQLIRACAQIAGVWTVCAMRSDSFPRIQQYPALVDLRSRGGDKDLLPPNSSELTQIIRQPAQMAGLSFEENEDGVTLDQVLADQAVAQPEGLPLLEFTLEQLYQNRSDEGFMTFEAYDRLGGLAGSIANKAEEIVAALPADVSGQLPSLLVQIISVDPQSGVAHRQPARVAALDDNAELAELVDALVNARLIVTALSSENEPVLNLVHESLLRLWPRIQLFIASEHEFLVARAQLEQAAAFWQSEGEPSDLLLLGTVLERGLELREEHRDDLDGITLGFIDASQRADRARAEAERRTLSAGRRRQRLGVGVVVLLSIVGLSAGYLAWSNSLSVQAAEVEEANRRVVSKARGFARLSQAYRDRGDILNALLVSLDAARLLPDSGNLSLLYDTLSDYQKRDVMRLTTTLGDGGRVFGDGANEGAFVVDAVGRAAYFERALDLPLTSSDRVRVTASGATMLVHGADQSLVLVDVASGNAISDFAFLAGAVEGVWVHDTHEAVLVHRSGERYSWLDLNAGRRVDFAWRNRVRDWDWSPSASRLVLMGETGELALHDTVSAAPRPIAANVHTIRVVGALLLAGGAERVVWDLTQGHERYRPDAGEQVLMSGDEVLIRSKSHVGFVDGGRIPAERVWALQGIAGFIASTRKTTHVLTRSMSFEVPRATFDAAEQADQLVLYQEGHLAYFDLQTGEMTEQVALPGSDHRAELHLAGTTSVVQSDGSLAIHVQGSLEVREVDALAGDEAWFELDDSGEHVIWRQSDIAIGRVDVADAGRALGYPHRAAITEVHYGQVRGVAAAVDDFDVVHIWSVRPPEVSFDIPTHAQVMESHHPELMGFFKDNMLKIFDRASGKAVLTAIAPQKVTAAIIPEGRRLVLFSTAGGGVFRVHEYGKPERLFAHGATVTGLHVTGGELFTAGRDGIATVYNLKSNEVVASIPHWGPVQGVEPVGNNLIASLTANGFLQFYDRVARRVVYFEHVGTTASAFAGSGADALVVVKEPNPGDAAMIDVVTGEYITQLPAAIDDVSRSLVSLDQTRALLVGAARPVRTLTGRTTEFAASLSLVDLVTSSALAQTNITFSNEAISAGQRQHSDGARIIATDASVIAGSIGEVRDWMTEASFSPDAAAALMVADSGELYLWDFDDEVITLFEAGDDRVTQANFTRDGEFIVARMATGGRRVWEVSSLEEADSAGGRRQVVGQRVQSVRLERGRITKVMRFAVDGSESVVQVFGDDLQNALLVGENQLLYQKDEFTVVVHDLGDGGEVVAIRTDEPISQLGWARFGRSLAAHSDDAPPKVYALPGGGLVRHGERLVLSEI